VKIAKELRELSDLELKEKVTELKAELFNLRFQHAVNQLENPQRIKAVRKQIAVIKTVQRARELAPQATAKG
jgi:large subunit ribosomal protein L29